MKQVTSALLERLASNATTVCTCWHITRTDGEQYGFTDHVEDVFFVDTIYKASTGYTRTAVSTNSTLAVDNVDLEGAVREAGITEQDCRAGCFDHATVEVFMVDYTAPELGRIRLRRGRLGELTLRDGIFITEIRGLAQNLTHTFIRSYNQACDAELGDLRCKKWISRNQGVIAGILVERRKFTVTLGEPFGGPVTDGYYSMGWMRFTSGYASGRAMEVKLHEGNTFTLFLPMNWEIQIGDTFTVSPGCDYTKETCKTRFNNLINFRGFPDVPGKGKIMKYGTSGR